MESPALWGAAEDTDGPGVLWALVRGPGGRDVPGDADLTQGSLGPRPARAEAEVVMPRYLCM